MVNFLQGRHGIDLVLSIYSESSLLFFFSVKWGWFLIFTKNIQQKLTELIFVALKNTFRE